MPQYHTHRRAKHGFGLILIVMCLSLILSLSTSAQDTQPTEDIAAQTVSTTPEPLPLSTEQPTLEPPTLEVPTEETVIVPTQETPSTPAPLPTQEVTVEPSPMDVTTTVVPTVGAITATLETPTSTSSPLPLAFSASFDSTYPAELSAKTGWTQVGVTDGQALQASTNSAPIVYKPTMFTEAVVEARFLLNAGEGQVTHGRYRAALSADGTVTLYRDQDVLASSEVTLEPNAWTLLRLDNRSSQLQVSVAGALVLSYTETIPATEGQAGFAASAAAMLRVDDFAVYGSVPLPRVDPTPEPLLVPTNVQVTAGADTVTVTWTDNNNTETHYLISLVLYNGQTILTRVPANTTSHTFTVGCGVLVGYRVKAARDATQTGYSSTTFVTTDPCVPRCDPTAAIQRISVGTMEQYQGTEIYAESLYGNSSGLSYDGRYVTFSNLGFMHPGEKVLEGTFSTWDGYRYDTQTCTLVNATLDGNPSYAHAITDDGSQVIVSIAHSSARRGAIYTPATGTTTPISVPPSLTEFNAVDVSPSGRYILIQGSASSYVVGIGDANSGSDVYLYDTVTQTYQVVSLATATQTGNSRSHAGEIFEYNGTVYVVFSSWASNLVANDTNNYSDVFLRNMSTGVTTRLSTYNTTQLPGDSYFADLAVVGSTLHVLFHHIVGLEVHLRQIDLSSLTSVAPDEKLIAFPFDPEGLVNGAKLSDDGRWFVFSTDASTFVPNDTNAKSDVFVRDLLNGTTQRVSATSSGDQLGEESRLIGISGDGRRILIKSFATTLVPGDNNAVCEVDEVDSDPVEPFNQYNYNDNCPELFLIRNPLFVGPSTPVIQAPGQGVTFGGTQPVFLWEAVAGAQEYKIEIDDISTFPSPQSATVTTNSYTPDPALPFLSPHVSYYWRVAAVANGLQSSWSITRSFKLIQPPDTPVMVAPANAAIINEIQPTFSWETVLNATEYKLQIDDDAAFASPQIFALTTTSYTPTPSLAAGTYYWRVAAAIGAVPSSWSAPRSMTLAQTPIAAPTSFTPSNGATVSDTPLVLSWQTVTGATEYTLEIDDESSFTQPYSVTGSSNSQTPVMPLGPKTYYWRVASLRGSEVSPWSQTQSFTFAYGPNTCQAQPASVSELITAIQAGNTAGAAYTICLLPNTIYTLTAQHVDFYQPVGLPVITSQGQITILGSGSTIERAANAPVFRLFGVNTGGKLTLKNMTLKQGRLTGNAGAALVSVQGIVTLDFVALENNQSVSMSEGRGGAIYNYQGTLTVTNSLFKENGAALSAGAVYAVDGTTTISGSCILNNTAQSWIEVGKSGGGIFTATGNWWGPEGVYTSAGEGVNAANPLTSAPNICNGLTQIQAPAPLTAPVLQAPADAATISELQPVFSWQAVTGATQYKIEIDNETSFTQPHSVTVTTNTYTHTLPFTTNTYYWRVAGLRDSEVSPWSQTRSFTFAYTQGSCQAQPATASELITAIQYGNSAGSLYTICLKPNTIYSLTTQYTAFHQPVGLPVITGQITILGSGSTIERAAHVSEFRLFGVNTGGKLRLENMTLKYGRLVANAGAALVIVQGNVTLDFVVLESNSSLNPSEGRGGAIYNYQGTLTVTNSLFKENSAMASAGAVYTWDGSTTISGSCIINNTAWDNVEVGKTGTGTVTATGNWWGLSGVGSSAGSGVNAANPLTSAPAICKGLTPGAALPAPTPLLPADAETVSNAQPTFSWQAVSGALEYKLEIDDDAAFASPSVVKVSTTSYTPNPPLAAGTYYWRVAAYSDIDQSGWSPARSVSITLSPLDTPTLLPVEQLGFGLVKFNWTPVADTTSYVIEVNDVCGDGSYIYRTETTNSGSFQMLQGSALYQGDHSYCVQAKNTQGQQGPFSAPGTFRIVFNYLPADGAFLPANQEISLQYYSFGTATYRVTIDDEPTFTPPYKHNVTVGAHNGIGLSKAQGLQDGIYYWRVRRMPDGIMIEPMIPAVYFTLKVGYPELIPTLQQPADNTTLTEVQPAFSWDAVPGADGYMLQIDDEANFSSPMPLISVSSNSYTPDPIFMAGTYYWRVSSVVNEEPYNPSIARKFTLKLTPGIPALQSPADGTILPNEWAVFSWNAATNAQKYTLQISEDAAFSLPQSITVNGTSYTPSPSLLADTYYWRVAAVSGTQVSDWSDVRLVELAQTLTAPLPQYPLDTDGTVIPTFSWTAVSGAQAYVIELDDNAAFTSPQAVNVAGLMTVSYKPETLALGKYYWRVAAVNSVHQSAWSTTYTFTLLEPMATPANLVGVGSSTSITVSWQDMMTSETSYLVEWIYNFYSLGANVTSLTVNNLGCGQTVWFRVRALRNGSESEWSAWASASTAPCIPTCDPAAAIQRVNVGSMNQYQAADGKYSQGLADGPPITANIATTAYLSQNGRYVLFNSSQPLTPSTTSELSAEPRTTQDVYRYDTQTCTTVKVSFDEANAETMSPMLPGAFTGDGTKAGFTSYYSSTLVISHNPAYAYIRDINQGTTKRLTLPALYSSIYYTVADISPDGRWILLNSGYMQSDGNVYLYDTQTDTHTLLRTRALGNSLFTVGGKTYVILFGIGHIYLHNVTDDISTELLVYDDETPMNPQTNVMYSGSSLSGTTLSVLFHVKGNDAKLYLRTVDLATPSVGTTQLITGNGVISNEMGETLSENGRWLIFTSIANGIVANDTNNRADVFVQDRVTNTIVRLAEAANAASYGISISPDGSRIVFISNATNLVPNDTNTLCGVLNPNCPDLFVVANPLYVGFLPAPLLLTPNDSATLTNTQPVLSWAAVPNATAYKLQIDNENTFNNPQLLNTTITGTTYAPTPELAPGTYYWRVATVSGVNESSWSTVQSFTLVNTPQIALLSPAQNGLLFPSGTATHANLVFKWEWLDPSETRSSYTVEIDTDPTFASVDKTCPTTSLTCTLNSVGYGVHYWRVVADNRTLLPIGTFTVSSAAPRAVTPVSPSNGRLLLPSERPAVTLTWSWGTASAPVGGPFTYEAEVSHTSTFDVLESSLLSILSQSVITPDLNDGTHFWRVRAVNVYGVPGAWSTPISFVIDSVTSFSVPVILAPTADAILTTARPVIRWSAITGVYRYSVEINELCGDGTPAHQSTALITTPTYTLPTTDSALPQGTYQVCVTAYDRSGNALMSAPRAFKVLLLLKPDAGVFIPTTTKPAFTWVAAPGKAGETVRYKVTLRRYVSDQEISVEESPLLTTTSYPWPNTLIPGTYRWQLVRVVNGVENPSGLRLLFVGPLPVGPTLTAPSSTTPFKTPVQLTWNPGIKPEGVEAINYQIQISRSTTFAPLLVDQAVQWDQPAAFSYTPDANQNRVTHYWRVRGLWDGVPVTNWSAGSFIIDNVGPARAVVTTAGLTPDRLVDSLRPIFTWAAVPTAIEYRVTLLNSANAEVGTPQTGSARSFTPTQNLAQNSYTLVVEASDGLNWSEPALYPFTVRLGTLPAQNSVVTTNRPTLTWQTVSGATSYSIEVDKVDGTALFSTPLVRTTVTTTRYTLSAAELLTSGVYVWRVKANNADYAADSAGRTFSYAAVLKPLNLKASSALTPNTVDTLFNSAEAASMVLSWQALTPSPLRYQIDISTSAGFTTTGTVTRTSLTPSLTLPGSELVGDGSKYWRVRGIYSSDATGYGLWSDVKSFTLDRQPPAVPAISTPNTITLNTGRPTFKWNVATGAVRYVLTVTDLATSNSVVGLTDLGMTTTSYTVPTNKAPLAQNVTPGYRWSVQAEDAAGNRSAAADGTFRVVASLSPTPNQFVPDSTPLFSWTGVSGLGAASWTLQIATDEAMEEIVYTSPLLTSTATSFTLPNEAELEVRDYYWRVTRSNENSSLVVPGQRFFAVPSLAGVTPTLIDPVNGGFNASDSLNGGGVLTWYAPSLLGYGAPLRYEVMIARANTFAANTVVLTTTTPTAERAMTLTDLPDGTYYWRVRIILEPGASLGPWSAIRSFRVDATAPGLPALTLPVSKAILTTRTPTFTWAAATGTPLQYILEIEDDEGTVVYTVALGASVLLHTLLADDALSNGGYVWRVRAKDAAGNYSLLVPGRDLIIAAP